MSADTDACDPSGREAWSSADGTWTEVVFAGKMTASIDKYYSNVEWHLWFDEHYEQHSYFFAVSTLGPGCIELRIVMV